MSSFTVLARSVSCGRAIRRSIVTFKYSVGSVVYSLREARTGKLTPVAIKSVKIPAGKDEATMYVDSYNWLWNEEELVIGSVAHEVAVDYLERRQAEILDFLGECGP